MMSGRIWRREYGGEWRCGGGSEDAGEEEDAGLVVDLALSDWLVMMLRRGDRRCQFRLLKRPLCHS